MTERRRNATNPLDAEVALISSTARGIGVPTARLMIKAGAKVVIGGVLDERGRETRNDHRWALGFPLLSLRRCYRFTLVLLGIVR
jgi:NAD(P)-dependent dehydrogenase (short-subunit alcohol dehydrogenase family)